MSLPAGVEELIGPYLARQRWYAGNGMPDPGALRVLDSTCLATRDGGRRQLHWAVVEVAGRSRYQLLIGQCAPTGDGVGVEGEDRVVLGRAGGSVVYDATFDPDLMLALFEQVVGTSASRVRPIGAEQSNTSLVFDDSVIVKVYRRLSDGVNPDIEVTSALAGVGFAHVAEPLGHWRADGVDLAFAQRFLAGGAEGWALALASVRALLEGPVDDPGAAAGDFGPEAGVLGQVTAQLHLALAQAFPVEAEGLRAGWAGFVDDLERRLRAEAGPAGLGDRSFDPFLDRLRSVRHPGPALRVHGDLHLGQTMRAGGRWYVLDFEGEPAREVGERVRPSSAAKDVSGMLRSFDYAARFALRGRDPLEAARDERRASAWERRNRAAFLEGYRGTAGVQDVLAAPEEADAVLAAYELDKALYELDYELAYRPDWVDIPRDAIARVVARPG